MDRAQPPQEDEAQVLEVAPGCAPGTLLTDAAICGLAATLFNEFPELRCTRIDVDPGDALQAGKDITNELLANALDDWVAYRDAYIEATYPAENKAIEYGSIYPLDVALLRAKLTQRQVTALEDLLQHYSAK